MLDTCNLEVTVYFCYDRYRMCVGKSMLVSAVLRLLFDRTDLQRKFKNKMSLNGLGFFFFSSSSSSSFSSFQQNMAKEMP